MRKSRSNPFPNAPQVRAVLSAENLSLVGAVARNGSMAAAARELGLVPSALTYRVRQIEDTLDVLLFDRSARQARITPAGAELLRSAEHLLQELDAAAERVRRVATGWEPQFTVVADSLISRTAIFELCEAFFAMGAPTRLRLRDETLTGTTESLQNGKSDLALGVATNGAGAAWAGVQTLPLGEVPFVFAVAPHHPLCQGTEPLSDQTIMAHRAVAVADSTQRGSGMSIGLLPGQDVFTVPTMAHKLQAQLRGMGCGFLPLPLAQPHVDAGRLVIRAVLRGPRVAHMGYAWRAANPGPAGASGLAAPPLGKALQWWLDQLAQPRTRCALLNHHPFSS
jgi:DNA-binding transcriptional LysR family regulator